MQNQFSIEKNDAWNYLHAHPLGTLATISAQGDPELALVYFTIDKDFSCYFVTKEATRKFQNIHERTVASLLCGSEDDLTTVELTGNAEVVMDTAQIVSIVERFQDVAMSRKSGYWVPPVSQLNAGYYVVCKFVPHTVQMNTYASDSNTPKRFSIDLRG